MAKSTRQYGFEGMELLPEALIPFVEKRLESSLADGQKVTYDLEKGRDGRESAINLRAL